MADRTGPLSRYTVLDLTRVRAGPTAVRFFADWGANCIKIEAPEAFDKAKGMGGARHGPDFQNLHRNKRGITLNLKAPEGKAAFMRLVEQADVVVENYRPDVKNRLGIDYESLKAVNPRIILGSISGFGQDGPYYLRPGFDQIAQGMGGLMSITGAPGEGPMRVGIPIADLSAGNYCAMAILMALLDREATGQGQWVRTSLLEAQIFMLDFQAARWTMTEEVAPQAGNNHPTSIPTGVFKTADGHINIAASGDSMWTRLCQALEAPDMEMDPRFVDGDQRSQNRDALSEAIESYTVGRSSSEWIKRFSEVGVPSGPIYSIDQTFADPQVEHLGMRHPVDHPEVGKFDIVAQPIKMSSHAPHTGAATPERGEHTEEVLGEFGFSADEIQALRDKQAV